MFAILASSLVLVLSIAIWRWIASVPLIQTLSMSIDCWADSVQGDEARPLR